MKDRKQIFGVETASSLLLLLSQWKFMDYDNNDNQILAAESVLSYNDAIDGDNLSVSDQIHQYFMRHRGSNYYLQSNTYLGFKDITSSYLLQKFRGPFLI